MEVREIVETAEVEAVVVPEEREVIFLMSIFFFLKTEETSAVEFACLTLIT